MCLPHHALWVACLALLLVISVESSVSQTAYTSRLSSTQVVGSSSYLLVTGQAVCILHRHPTRPSLECHVESNMTAPTEMLIAAAARGLDGPTIFSFESPLSDAMSRRWEFLAVNGLSISAQVDSFLRGQFYVLVEGEEGIIRGQLEQSSRFYAFMDSTQTIPPALGYNHGIALASYSFSSPMRKMSLSVIHDVQEARALTLREGAPNQVGDILYTFVREGGQMVVSDSVQLSPQEEVSAFEDLLYLNLASTPNPEGAIRGQLISTDYIQEASFTAILTGEQVRPNPVNTEFSGCALFVYSCNTRVLEVIVVHNLRNSTGGAIATGSSDEDGVIITALTNAGAPTYGSVVLDDPLYVDLYSQEIFVEIYDAQGNPTLRGTASVEWDFYAYLSSSTELPSVSTPAKGVVVDQLVNTTSQTDMRFIMAHTVEDPVVVELHRAKEGQTGPFRVSIVNLTRTVEGETMYSPIPGVVNMFLNDVTRLVNEEYYWEIPSRAYPLGEIRGQMKRINPCVQQGVVVPVDSSNVNVFSYFGSTDVTFFSKQYNIIYVSPATLLQPAWLMLITTLMGWWLWL